MDRALTLIDVLIENNPDLVDDLTQLREIVADPTLDELEAIIEKIASDKMKKLQLIKRGKRLIKVIMGK